MVSQLTFILITITFIISHIVFDKNNKRLFEDKKGWKIIVSILLVEIMLVIISMQISIVFYILIYATIINASYLECFYRYKRRQIYLKYEE